jgi:hypothetical protein
LKPGQPGAENDPVYQLVKEGILRAQDPACVGRGVAYLCSLSDNPGKDANGYGLYVQQGKYVNYEAGYHATTPQWMNPEIMEGEAGLRYLPHAHLRARQIVVWRMATKQTLLDCPKHLTANDLFFRRQPICLLCRAILPA